MKTTSPDPLNPPSSQNPPPPAESATPPPASAAVASPTEVPKPQEPISEALLLGDGSAPPCGCAARWLETYLAWKLEEEKNLGRLLELAARKTPPPASREGAQLSAIISRRFSAQSFAAAVRTGAERDSITVGCMRQQIGEIDINLSDELGAIGVESREFADCLNNTIPLVGEHQVRASHFKPTMRVDACIFFVRYR